MSTILSATRVTKTFGGFTALDDVSFALDRACTLGVVGESGSGKSTLGRIVMRLLAPDAGTVRLGDVDLFSLGRSALRAARRRIQLVPQDPRHALNPTMTVGQTLGFQMSAQGVDRGIQRRRSEELLDRVSLTADYLHAYPHELSGGQAQRIAIARAIAGEPEVLVCDEAVSALDKSVQAQVLNTLATLQADLGLSLFFISHDLAVVEHFSDDVLVLSRGHVVESGPTRAVLGAPQDPYTRELVDARHSVRAA